MRYFDDRVKETSTTPGTGNFTLAGAVSQFQVFSADHATNDPNDDFDYAIVGQSGTEWEVGRGYLSGATTLVRSRVIKSSNSHALVSFSAGTKDVFLTISSESMNARPSYGQMIAAISGANMP